MFADTGGVGHGSACPKKQTKKKERKEKNEKNAEELFVVLMLLFYFYTGVYGGDHVEPTAAICAIISEWNATETLILRVYIYMLVMITEHFQLFAEMPFRC